MFAGADLELRDVALMRPPQQMPHGLIKAIASVGSDRDNMSHLT
ncbi:MAG: hypothetical protein JWO26_3825, partial [Rhodospirillales bacterium]|nr:hypothetical protein [Rhodospirillales bacterium]